MMSSIVGRHRWRGWAGAAVVLAVVFVAPARGQFGGARREGPEEKAERDRQQAIAKAKVEIQVLEALIAVKRAEVQLAEAEEAYRQSGGDPKRLKTMLDDLRRASTPFPDARTLDAPRATLSRPPSQPPRPPVDPNTQAILDKLEQPISIRFDAATPLSDAIKYIKHATVDRSLPEGLPFYIDPDGLKETGSTETSDIKLASDSVPLKHCLRMLLNQLRLDYTVRDGFVYISSVAAIERGDEPRNKGRADANSGAAPRSVDLRTQAILDQLEQPISMPFAKPTPLKEVLKYIKQATSARMLPEGIPIYVDPIGLQEADKTEDLPIKINFEGVPLKRSLEVLLKQLGLAYGIKDGLMTISSQEAVRRQQGGADARSGAERGRDPRTQAILDQLDKPISMPFADPTPLEDVIRYIKRATVSRLHPEGIPIYIDPIGLQETNKKESSPITINLEGVPLKRSLKLLLSQLGMDYSVKDGLMTVTSKEAVDRPIERPKAPDAAKTLAIRKLLDKVVVIPFPDETPFEEVLKFIKDNSAGPGFPEGLPIFVDPDGLKKVGRTLATRVRLRTDHAPLKRSLTLLLKPMGLTYTVADGVLKIVAASDEPDPGDEGDR